MRLYAIECARLTVEVFKQGPVAKTDTEIGVSSDPRKTIGCFEIESPTPSKKLWPIKESARALVVKSLTMNLATPNIRSRKYGFTFLEKNEAHMEARKIEDAAYSAAYQYFLKEADVDGCPVLQLYAKECIRRMIEALKLSAIAQTDREIGETSFRTKLVNIGDPEKKLNLFNERRYRYRELRFKTRFGPKAAVVAKLTFPSTRDESSLEVVTIFSSAAEGDKLRYLNVSNNALYETEIGAFEDFLTSHYTLEEQQDLLEEEVEEKVLNLLKKAGTGYRYAKLRIRSTSFCQEAASVVAKPILSFIKDQLNAVELSDFVFGRDDDEVLEVMHIFSSALGGCKLRCLNLSNIAVLGIRDFGTLLKSQNNLEELYLLNVGICAEAVGKLIPLTDKLRVLQFDGDPILVQGGKCISEIVSKCPLLEDFRCSDSHANSLGDGALVKALGKCKYLKKLDLRYNPLLSDSALGLSKALTAFSGLTEIYLSHTFWNNEGCIEIVNALMESAPYLQVLDMAGNRISAEAAPALVSCIASKKCLAKLNLGENSLMDEGAIIIAKELGKPETHDELCEVDLHKNMIGRDGGSAIAMAVFKKPRLKVLNITHNHICPNDWRSKVESLFWNRPHVLVPLDNEEFTRN
ncbi:hypothetical protein ACS0TY_007599 [Phlomoides rotata]